VTLAVAARHRLGAFELDIAFEAGPGITALFGPSGSGKTSVIRVVAGLLRPADGRVVVGGTTLLDRPAGIDVPTHRRRVGYVFQDARLFPHLSVRTNLVFGRWFAPRTARQESLDRMVDLLGIGHLLARRPATLSGGEAQRVAIGRALLSGPRILLLDEPLSGLDRTRQDEIMPYLERLRDEVRLPMLYVSHVEDEVRRLATTVVRLEAGRVVAAGPVARTLGPLGAPSKLA